MEQIYQIGKKIWMGFFFRGGQSLRKLKKMKKMGKVKKFKGVKGGDFLIFYFFISKVCSISDVFLIGVF